jgi:uncharacterized protein YegJ (DUF2314 family)
MWVEVVRWKGDMIRGILKNDPVYVPDLQKGQEVFVAEHEVFDYVRVHSDGTQEGNETGAAIAAAEKRKSTQKK